MDDFVLFERVRIRRGEYAGKEGVIERILTYTVEGDITYEDNRGLWVEIDNVFGLKRFQPGEVEHITSEVYRAKQKIEHLEMRDM